MSGFLVGKTINAIKIADDKQAILFICDDGEHIARTDGDCCSYSWCEHIELPALGFPCKVISQSELDLNIPDLSNNEFECCAFYGHKIVTDKGEITIDYRNESNGYYGGNLVWPDNGYFYGGVHGQNVSSENWVDVD